MDHDKEIMDHRMRWRVYCLLDDIGTVFKFNQYSPKTYREKHWLDVMNSLYYDEINDEFVGNLEEYVEQLKKVENKELERHDIIEYEHCGSSSSNSSDDEEEEEEEISYRINIKDLIFKLECAIKHINGLKNPPQFNGNEKLQKNMEEIMKWTLSTQKYHRNYSLREMDYLYVVDKDEFLFHMEELKSRAAKKCESLELRISCSQRIGYDTEKQKVELSKYKSIKKMIRKCMRNC